MDFSWSDSALNLRFDTEVTDELIGLFSECNPTCDYNTIEDLAGHIRAGKLFTIYPSRSNLFICDEQFIQCCLDPIQLFDYYKEKINPERELLTVNFNSRPSAIVKIVDSEESRKIYHELLDTIILDLGALKKHAITTSPKIFHYLSELNQSDTPYCRFMSEFLSIMAISDRVIAIDESLTDLEFQISSNDVTKKFHYKWKDSSINKNDFWYECYKWITSDEQKSVDVKLKRHIVREVITKNYTTENIADFTSEQIAEMYRHFDNILRLIVSGRSKEYFDTQKTIKSEYVDIYTKNFDSFTNVVNTILGLIVALAAGLYGILYTQGGSIDLLSPNKSVGMLFMLVLLAEIFVLISTFAKFLSRRCYIKKLRRINCDKLLISENDQKCLANNNIGLEILIYITLILAIAFTIWGINWYMRTGT